MPCVERTAAMPCHAEASRELKARVLRKYAAASFILAALLFLPAGTLGYMEAWVWLALLLVPMGGMLLYLLNRDPALLERRMKHREREPEQKAIIRIMTPLFLLAFILPGLDHRFGWSHVPSAIVLAASIFFFLGYLFIMLVLRENSYASRVVEVEAGQSVITTGPYAVIRHPMYLGLILMLLATPPALGSYWSYSLFLFLPLFFFPRINNEEKVLLRELRGYREYCAKTRYRLIPFLW